MKLGLKTYELRACRARPGLALSGPLFFVFERNLVRQACAA